MSQDPHELRPSCPGCGEVLEPAWKVCPHCGLHLKPSNDLLVRALFWAIAVFVFAFVCLSIAQTDADSARGFALVFGIPLAYVFGKAVIFRIQGTPLTWRQLRQSSFRAGTFVFFLLVVAPIVIGIALLLLLFAICGITTGFGPSH